MTDHVRAPALAAHRGAGDPLARAASALNQAALIASDCGLPDLARTLCWRQFTTYERNQPLTGPAARYALEPVVNLARLHLRAGEGTVAYDLVEGLYQAVRTKADAVIDGRSTSFARLTNADEDHRTLCQWLWAVVLAEGVRALASDGRWDDAVAHAERHQGIGRRLLDGRQATVIAHALAGDTRTSLALLDASTTTEPSERAVAACLRTLCTTFEGVTSAPTVTEMTDVYLHLDSAPGHLAFRIRLGLSVIDLAAGTDHPGLNEVVARMVTDASTTGDGHVAQAVLGNDRCRQSLSTAHERTLSAAVQCSGVGRGEMPGHVLADLIAGVEMSQEVTAKQSAYRVLRDL